METTTIELWAREIMSVALLLPLLWYFIRSFTKTNQDGFKAIVESIKQHDETSKNLFKTIISATGKTVLSNEQIIEVARARVWLTSEKKLAFIRKRLEKNNLWDRTDIIKKQIRTELERRSEEYISFLNGFSCPIGLVGVWVATEFPMDEFMEELYDVIFRKRNEKLTEAECISQKVDDCRFIMSAYQNDLWEKLKKELYE